jgi:hypothetical protein
MKDRACRDVLLHLNNKGIIQLPEPRYKLEKQKITIKPVDFFESKEEIHGNLNNFDIKTLRFELVKNAYQRKIWNFLIARYHYLGCNVIVGRHLKYLIYLEDQIIGCIGFGDAVLQLKTRDQWIGWDNKTREANLHLVINNVRFLILPWVKIKNLASKILSISVKIVPKDWQSFFVYKPVLIETFVDRKRFFGTSYKAANWIYLGKTRGIGRSGMNYYRHGVVKDVYVYPLAKDVGLILKNN